MTSTAFQTTDSLTVVDTTPAVVDVSLRPTARTVAGILAGVLAVAAVATGAAYVGGSGGSPAATTTNAASGTGSVSTTTETLPRGHGTSISRTSVTARAASVTSAAKQAEILHVIAG